MKIFSRILIILFSIILCIYTNSYEILPRKINSSNVKDNIKTLSSNNFKGRLPGTLGNSEAAAYIKNEFIKANLKPLNDSYTESFNAIYPEKLASKPFLKISDSSGSLIKEFTYGVDYKEDLINFRTNTVTINNKNIFLVGDEGFQVKTDSNFIFFKIQDDNDFSFRSSFLHESNISLMLFISRDTFETIKKEILYSENTLQCYIPYQTSETVVQNVVGMIEGKNSSLPPLVLSAHFDHIGQDLRGTIYNGALDNASGVSFIIELANILSSGPKPDRNIIFAAFNGEEFGFLGSKHFINNNLNLLANSTVLNFDMIGSNINLPLSIVANKTDTSELRIIKDIVSIGTKSNIETNLIFEDYSDHYYFRKNNIEAVTLCNNDMSKIHTPNDTIDHIGDKSIENCYSIVSKVVSNVIYSNTHIYKYKWFISFIFATIAIYFIGLFLTDLKKSKCTVQYRKKV